MTAFPTSAEIDRAAALSDPVRRNLQITQAYHELSQALAGALGPSANWCAFAAWAFKQAGQTIRKQDLSRVFEDAGRKEVLSGAKILGFKASSLPP